MTRRESKIVSVCVGFLLIGCASEPAPDSGAPTAACSPQVLSVSFVITSPPAPAADVQKLNAEFGDLDLSACELAQGQVVELIGAVKDGHVVVSTEIAEHRHKNRCVQPVKYLRTSIEYPFEFAGTVRRVR